MGLQSDRRDYYEILHVHRDAPAEIIRSSYRTLMQQMKNHPDLGGDTRTAALINEAYAVLNDPARRAEYDAQQAVLRQAAEGFAEDTVTSKPATEPRRILDPARQCVFCEMPHGRDGIIEADDRCSNCKSPLCAAKDLQIESSDQRAVERIGKRLQLTFFTQWPQTTGFTGRTEDISPNGLRLVTSCGLANGQYIKICSSVFDAVGSVANCTPRRRGWSTKYVAGISFVTLRFNTSAGAFISRRV